MNTTQKRTVWAMVEKVEHAGVIRLTGAMRADDWKELATMAAECREMLVADSVAEIVAVESRLCDWCDDDATKRREDGDGFKSHACDVHAAQYFEEVPA